MANNSLSTGEKDFKGIPSSAQSLEYIAAEIAWDMYERKKFMKQKINYLEQ